MRIKHIGTRPRFKIERVDDSRQSVRYFEEFPDGGGKYWNKRTLNSGCGGVIGRMLIEDDLVYCDTCDEWFHVCQFAKVGDE